MQEVEVDEIYEVEKKLGTGRFGNIHRARHRQSGATIALKIFPRQFKEITQTEFIREYKTSFFLTAHPNIIDTYEGAYFTPDIYFFVQELSACGSLRDIVERNPNGLLEEYCKKVLRQLLAALEFIHAENLVHRNIQAKNVLIFDTQFSRIKLADFGLTRREKTMVKHFDVANPYHAPELCDVIQKEMYAVNKSVDTWAIGVLMFFCLRGQYPWDQAKFTFHAFWEWKEWNTGKSMKLPGQFSRFTDRFLKFFKRTLNPIASERYYRVKEMRKYLNDAWMRDAKMYDSSADYYYPKESQPQVSSQNNGFSQAKKFQPQHPAKQQAGLRRRSNSFTADETPEVTEQSLISHDNSYAQFAENEEEVTVRRDFRRNWLGEPGKGDSGSNSPKGFVRSLFQSTFRRRRSSTRKGLQGIRRTASAMENSLDEFAVNQGY